MKTTQKDVEVWKNTSNGTRWYICFDLQGREVTKVVRGNSTFTLTPFERQINQERAAEPHMDLFRNGTFVLVKPTEETNREEFESPDALTDLEIQQIVNNLIAKTITVAEAIRDIESPITLGRLWEALVIEDAPRSIIDAVKQKKDSKEATVAHERQVVYTEPDKR